MRKTQFSAVLSTFILCMAVWILLTWSFEIQELAAGVIVSLGTALFSSRFFIHDNAFRFLNPLNLIKLVLFGFVLLKEIIKANCSMAARVLGGCKNVNPGIVRIPTDMKSDYGLCLLANCITLTPGTITMDVAEEDGQNYYYVHWIDVTETDRKAAGDVIKSKLEKGARRVFD
ncbi:MAG: Na+/H+ antiporter subunit E [Eubacteriales bacterium]|nr:Na+/H+ antiporter subunit E [Eubacteriales bacterium]